MSDLRTKTVAQLPLTTTAAGSDRFLLWQDSVFKQISPLNIFSVLDGDKGDITVSSSGAVWTIDTGAVVTAKIADNAITNAKAADMATQTIKGRDTAGTGDPEDLSAATVRTILGLAPIATSGSASDLATGTLPDARLSSNVARRDQANTFSANQTVAVAANDAVAIVNQTDARATNSFRPTLLFCKAGVTALAISSEGSVAGAGQAYYEATGSSARHEFYCAGTLRSQIDQSGLRLVGLLRIDADDVSLARDAANALAQRNGVNPQTFRVYETFTDVLNYARLSVYLSGNYWRFNPEQAGTGTGKGLVIGGSSSGTSEVYIRAQHNTGAGSVVVNLLGLWPEVDNNPDLGGAAARFKNFYLASWFRQTPKTVASLASASTAGAGARDFVSDANATTFASIVNGGGSNIVPVYSDGTDWRIG